MSISRVMPFAVPGMRFGTAEPPDARLSGLSRIMPADHRPDERKYVAPLVQLQHLVNMRSHTFRAEFKKVIDDAKAYLQVFIENKQAAQSAVVLDLDETLLDNSAFELIRIQKAITQDKTPYWKTYTDWLKRAEAPAIPETLEFVKWLKDNKFPIYFVSSRKEYFKPHTVENLKRIGVPPGDYAGIYLKPNDFAVTDSISAFKVWAQKDIERNRGQKVVAMMGDQDSDLDGALGRGFKLPNPL